MTESQLHELFSQIADGDGDPSPVVTRLAVQRGRARLRRRRACLAGVPVLVVAIAVAVAVVAGPFRHGAAPPATGPGPAAPRQFSPLSTNLSLGWLPAGQSVEQGGVERTEAFLLTGGKVGIFGWNVSAFARGACHLTRPARMLTCFPGSGSGTTSGPLGDRAPAVNGHPAFWSGTWLVWQYARGGWAWLDAPIYSKSLLQNNPAARAKAIRIARHLRVGAGAPALLFPARFPGLASHWQLTSMQNYEAETGGLTGEQYILTSRTSRFLPQVGDTGIWTNALYINVHPAPHYDTCSPHDPAYQHTSEVINGYHVVLKRMNVRSYLPMQELCAGHADGLWVDIQEFGAHPPTSVASVFRHHVRLLGTSPANWSRSPLG